MRNNTEKISDLMRLFWQENPEVYHKMLEERVKRLWMELFGNAIAKNTSGVYIKNKVLYVSMTSSVLRNEMIMQRRSIVKKLNDEAHSDVIDDVVIR